MQLRATTVLAAAMLLLAPAASRADLSAYSENFEGLNQADPAALGNAGWLVFGNVFDPAMNYLYGYGVFPAPNGSGGFCNVAAGEGGPGQGAQQLVVFSDYNNGDQANGNLIEANVFHEQTIGAADVGTSWDFQFDAKLGDLVAPTTAIAFIKTLDPNAGYATTTFLTLDTTSLPAMWNTYSISIPIGPGLVGNVLQIGFANTTTNYTPSGVFYDNINFAPGGATPVESSTWGRVKTLYR
jgi:hypothetical protein